MPPSPGGPPLRPAAGGRWRDRAPGPPPAPPGPRDAAAAASRTASTTCWSGPAGGPSSTTSLCEYRGSRGDAGCSNPPSKGWSRASRSGRSPVGRRAAGRERARCTQELRDSRRCEPRLHWRSFSVSVWGGGDAPPVPAAAAGAGAVGAARWGSSAADFSEGRR